MKTATINFKTEEAVKTQAQQLAQQIGIPLGSLLNAYLHDFVTSKTVYFSRDEKMTEKMERIIAEVNRQIENGDISKDLTNPAEALAHLDSLV